jgi:sRNA-binding carbon storage regulator CsrA
LIRIKQKRGAGTIKLEVADAIEIQVVEMKETQYKIGADAKETLVADKWRKQDKFEADTKEAGNTVKQTKCDTWGCTFIGYGYSRTIGIRAMANSGSNSGSKWIRSLNKGICLLRFQVHAMTRVETGRASEHKSVRASEQGKLCNNWWSKSAYTKPTQKSNTSIEREG